MPNDRNFAVTSRIPGREGSVERRSPSPSSTTRILSLLQLRNLVRLKVVRIPATMIIVRAESRNSNLPSRNGTPYPQLHRLLLAITNQAARRMTLNSDVRNHLQAPQRSVRLHSLYFWKWSYSQRRGWWDCGCGEVGRWQEGMYVPPSLFYLPNHTE